MPDPTSHTNRRCEKLIHMIAMKHDKHYRRRYLKGGTGYNKDEIDKMREAAINARARGEIKAPGDEQRKFLVKD
jgi:hypothetical protein